jgi:hypothetical protein
MAGQRQQQQKTLAAYHTQQAGINAWSTFVCDECGPAYTAVNVDADLKLVCSPYDQYHA